MTAQERLAELRSEVDKFDLTLRSLRGETNSMRIAERLREIDAHARAVALHAEHLRDLAHALKGSTSSKG